MLPAFKVDMYNKLTSPKWFSPVIDSTRSVCLHFTFTSCISLSSSILADITPGMLTLTLHTTVGSF